MEERFLLLGGRGSLTLTGEGDKVRTEVNLEDDGRGLYKAYLLGRGGRLPLGALTPGKDGLSLTRVLSRADLERRGFWPPRGASVELAFSFAPKRSQGVPPPPSGWRRESCPERLPEDFILRQSAQGLRGGLLRREETGFRLAFPWRENCPFPLTPLFCFAVLKRLGSDHYAVFRFDGKGHPIF